MSANWIYPHNRKFALPHVGLRRRAGASAEIHGIKKRRETSPRPTDIGIVCAYNLWGKYDFVLLILFPRWGRLFVAANYYV